MAWTLRLSQHLMFWKLSVQALELETAVWSGSGLHEMPVLVTTGRGTGIELISGAKKSSTPSTLHHADGPQAELAPRRCTSALIRRTRRFETGCPGGEVEGPPSP